jgi:integrase
MVRIPVHARGAENKGVPAALPLSRRAVDAVNSLHPVDELGLPVVTPTGLILDTTPNAVMRVWKRILPILQIEDLRWHDLRHEAASRLFEKGLHPMEVATITGHKSMQMLRRYTHLRAENLIEKLG